MTYPNHFVELDKKIHDRTQFDCGEETLNKFLHTQASKHMEQGLSVTHVLTGLKPNENGKFPILAFYTIAHGSTHRNDFPPKTAKKLPPYPISTLLLAQLAVDHNHHGKGLGKVTLLMSLKHLLHIHQTLRAFAIMVDCLNEDVVQFYKKYGFEIADEKNKKERIPMYMFTKTLEGLEMLLE